MTEIVALVARPLVAGQIIRRRRRFIGRIGVSPWPGGWAEVRGRNLSTTCSSSEIMGRWVFTAADPRKILHLS